MRYYCLYFPTLATDLARQARGGDGEGPLVLVQGAGEGAVVTAVSPLALARGAAPGMTVGEARARCGSALFLPDNAGACLDELERLVSILRRYATDSVAIGGRDHVFLSTDDTHEPAVMARRLLAVTRSWFRHENRAGVAGSPAAALEAARCARRAPVVIDEPSVPRKIMPGASAGQIGGATGVRGDGLVALRREVFCLLTRLEKILAGRSQGFREVRLEVEAGEAVRSLRLRFENPAYTSAEVLARLDRHLNAPGLAPASRVRVTLSRLCPDVREQHASAHPEPLPAAV